MAEPNVARLIRENTSLRKACAAAARLRRIGRICDQIEESNEELWRENPDMTRCLTGTFMARTSYEEALKTFDAALLEAADVFARDPYAEELSLGASPALSQERDG